MGRLLAASFHFVRMTAAMSSQSLTFVQRCQPVTVHRVPPDRTLLQVLREDLGQTAVKEGCNEGDCGACTVVIGEPRDGRLELRAVNSCIRLAHSVDRMAVWTAQDLLHDPALASATPASPTSPKANALHPVQQAMVNCHASQCGFCTPGFVMSLFALYENAVLRDAAVSPCAVTRREAQEALSGNLCRCTGYRPILDAAQSLHQLPPTPLNHAAVLKTLKALPRNTPATDAGYLRPATLPALLQARAQHPDAQIVAGATDLGLWITKQHRRFDRLLDVTRVRELRRIESYPNHIAIGAAATLHEAWSALEHLWPSLHDFAQRFAGLPVRRSGTLGGNVVNGSPIGDSMPLLIALGANVVLMSQRGHRELRLEDLYTGYRRNVIASDEVLAWIKVPRPQAGEWLAAYKVSKRWDDDISAVCLAVRLQLQGDGHTRRVVRASMGAGGVAATPARATQTEALLHGRDWTEATAMAAGEQLATEFTPLSDLRASAEWRRALLRALMQRAWLESGGTTHRLESLDLAALDALEAA
jgi:xanthine dehydrogenase small subunit